MSGKRSLLLREGNHFSGAEPLFQRAGQKAVPEIGFGGVENADLLGTITSVNTESKILTVKDADGKETQVHVNPFTRLKERKRPADSDRLPAQKNKKADRTQNNFPKPENDELELADLKAGDWVAVKKMKAETKTIEAARIIVAKE